MKPQQGYIPNQTEKPIIPEQIPENMDEVVTPEQPIEKAEEPSFESVEEDIQKKQEYIEETDQQLRAVRERLGLDPDNGDAPALDVERFQFEKMKSLRENMRKQGEEMLKQKERLEETLKWYKKAKEKADTFISSVDPLYSVEVISVNVSLNGGAEQESIVLAFRHNQDSSKEWTMNIDTSDEYINGRFENVVRGIIEEKAQEFVPDRQNYEDVEDGFGDQKFEELEGKERMKSREEMQVIDLTNEVTDKVRQAYGLEDISIPDKAIHMIKESEWEGKGTAMFVEELKVIAIKETPRLQIFKKKIVHEMFHLKSNNLLPKAFNEAVTEKATMDAFRLIENEPLTSLERMQSEKIRSEYPHARSEDGSPLFSEDTFLAYVDDKGMLHSENFTYKEERELLDTFTQNLFERSNGLFKSKDEVFRTFLRANLSGDSSLLEVVDRIYGEGTLKAMNEAGSDVSKLREVIEAKGEVPQEQQEVIKVTETTKPTETVQQNTKEVPAGSVPQEVFSKIMLERLRQIPEAPTEKRKEANMEDIFSSSNRLLQNLEDLSTALNRNGFPRVSFKWQKIGSENFDEREMIKGIENLTESLSKVNLPEGRERLKLEPHNIRKVMDNLDYVRKDLSRMRSLFESSHPELAKETTRAINRLGRVYEGLSEAVILLQRYKGR